MLHNPGIRRFFASLSTWMRVPQASISQTPPYPLTIAEWVDIQAEERQALEEQEQVRVLEEKRGLAHAGGSS